MSNAILNSHKRDLLLYGFPNIPAEDRPDYRLALDAFHADDLGMIISDTEGLIEMLTAEMKRELESDVDGEGDRFRRLKRQRSGQKIRLEALVEIRDSGF